MPSDSTDLIDFPIGDLYRNWAIARGLINTPYVTPPPGYKAIRYPFDTPTDEVWFAEHGSPPSLNAPGSLLEPAPPKQKQPAPKPRLAPIRRSGVDV